MNDKTERDLLSDASYILQYMQHIGRMLGLLTPSATKTLDACVLLSKQAANGESERLSLEIVIKAFLDEIESVDTIGDMTKVQVGALRTFVVAALVNVQKAKAHD